MTDDYTMLARCMDCEPHEVSGLIQQHAPWNGKSMCDDALRERAAVVERTEHARSSLDTALMLERERERAAVVAWLYRNHYDDTATRIERGEHRREETS